MQASNNKTEPFNFFLGTLAMNLQRLWRFLRPKTGTEWLVLAGILGLLGIVVPTGAHSLSAAGGITALLFLVAVAATISGRERVFWTRVPWVLRGVVLFVICYTSIVAIGNGRDIGSFENLKDYLLTINNAPITLSHLAAILFGFALFVRQRDIKPLIEKPADPAPLRISGPIVISEESAIQIGESLVKKALANAPIQDAKGEPTIDIFQWDTVPLPVDSATEHFTLVGKPTLIKKALATTPAKDATGEPIVPNKDIIQWGSVPLPIDCATQHFALVGTTGSGKSTLISILLKSILPHFRPGSNRRAIIFDAKRDIMSVLAGLKPPCPVINFHPFDTRGWAWDIAKDIDSDSTAMEIATVFVPEMPNSSNTERFFQDAARRLSAGLMRAFMHHCPGKWTLRDVVLGFNSIKRLKTLLSLPQGDKYESTRHLYKELVAPNETSFGIRGEMGNVLQRLTFIASAWASSGAQKFSLKDFVKGEYVLVLGRDPTQESTVKQLNAILVNRLTQLMIGQEEARTEAARGKPEPLSWVIIDELRAAGYLDGVKHLLFEGRSKGIAGVIGFQDFPGMKHEFGEQLAEEIFGLCNNKAFLRQGDNTSDEYASRHFGIEEFELTQFTANEGATITYQDGQTTRAFATGWSEHRSRHSRRAFELGFFARIPKADFEKFGIAGVFDTAAIGYPYKMHLKPPIDRLVPKPVPWVSNFSPRESEKQRLRRWTDEDLERLNLLAHRKELLSGDDDDEGSEDGGTKSAGPDAGDDGPIKPLHNFDLI
jgi:hypothetical protein